MELLPDSFLETLPEEPMDALLAISTRLNAHLMATPSGVELHMAIDLLAAFAEENGFKLQEPSDVLLDAANDPTRLRARFYIEQIDDLYKQSASNSIRLKAKAITARLELKRRKALPQYSLTDSEHSRVQELINQLRDEVASATYLSEEHRIRLQKRLEGLQRELHKTISDLDKFWGLCVEASMIMKKCGENAKPLVDRVRELTDIFFRVVSKTEGLPYSSPFNLSDGE